VKSNFTLNNNLGKLTFATRHVIQGEEIMGYSTSSHISQNIFIVLFIIVSSVLLIRFAFNIFRIIRKIIKCKKIKKVNVSLVLVEEKTIPYSFFRYVFVNQSDFENGKIEKELLIHEEAHCLQYHSVDIILLELINVFFWFNPTIWLFRKEILLNHEYYADNKVLVSNKSFDYHKLLLNLVIQNNTNYLVSNFKYSLIKNRIIMMTKSRPSHNAILRKIAASTLFLFLGIAFTFSQENMLNKNTSNFENGWWYSILQKHKIDLKQFNYKNTFDMGMNDTINNFWLEIGNSDSLNNRNIPFKDAIFIYKGSGQTYWIWTSEYARHDLDNNIIILKNGKSACYDFIYKNIIPTQTSTFQEGRIDIKRNWISTLSNYNN
jgi:hypothetical protein